MHFFLKGSNRKPEVNYSRSKNLSHASLSKIQDLTRYNSSKCNVYLYKDSPNRQLTPIRAPGYAKTSQGFMPRECDQQMRMLTTIAKGFDNIPTSTKTRFVREASKASLRTNMLLPSMTENRIRKIPYILNDNHIRETNPGFARNDYGGFFTH